MVMSAIRQAVVLCGGIGSRLGAITRDTPKPLLPVADKPFLERLLFEIHRFGIRRVLFLAAYRAEAIEAFAAEACPRLGIDFEIAVEPDRAGTGGALWHASSHLDELFLLFNGDSWFDINILDLALRLGSDDVLAMAVRHVDDTSRYGSVELVGDRVRRFSEKAGLAEPGLVNGGVYVARRSLTGYLAPRCSLEQHGLATLAREDRVSGTAYDGFFLDIGLPEELGRAQAAVPAAQRRAAVFFDRDGVLNEDRGYVGEVARFAWLPGAREAIKALNDRGVLVFVVTNQSGIARGFYGEAAVRDLHHHMQMELRTIGAHIDDFRYCPYHEEGVVPAYRRSSQWRKPAPGMILDLLAHWYVDRRRCVLIGDQDHDMTAAAAAGITGCKLAPGQHIATLLEGAPCSDLLAKRASEHDSAN